MTTQLTLDLNKVVLCRYWYETQDGVTSRIKPSLPSVRGLTFNSAAFAPTHYDYPLETLIERAIRLDILDEWVAKCLCKTVSGYTVKYTGKKATSIWEAYKAITFSKRKNK